MTYIIKLYKSNNVLILSKPVVNDLIVINSGLDLLGVICCVILTW